MKKAALALTVVFLVLSTASAFADDLRPAPWRGWPGSTWAKWEYLTPDPNPLPDAGCNPYGCPTTTIYPGVGQVWWAELNGRYGVWPLSGEIWVDVPNRPETSPYKDIWIQLTWEPQAPGNTPFVLTTLPQQVNGTLIQQTQLEGAWVHSVYKIRLEPNPSWEQILITGGIDVDELVIDTICIPEPGSIFALAGGLAGLLGFVRIRRF